MTVAQVLIGAGHGESVTTGGSRVVREHSPALIDPPSAAARHARRDELTRTWSAPPRTFLMLNPGHRGRKVRRPETITRCRRFARAGLAPAAGAAGGQAADQMIIPPGRRSRIRLSLISCLPAWRARKEQP